MVDYILTLEHEVRDCRYCPCVRFSHPTDDENHGNCVCAAYHDDLNGSNIIEKDVSWVDMLDCKGSKKIEKPSWCPMRLRASRE